MKSLAILVALFAAAAAFVAVRIGDTTTGLLAATSLICAYTTFRSQHISSYLRIFVAIFAIEVIVFGVLCLAAQLHQWPREWADYEIPESLPLSVAFFAIGVYAISFVPLVRAMMRIADRYFDSRDVAGARIWPFPSYRAAERKIGAAMVVFLVLINQAEVGINIRLSFFSRDWFNAIQNKDAKAFWYQLFTVFLVWAFLYIFAAVVEYVVTSTMVIRWRRWLTGYYLDRWLDNHRHYRMSLAGSPADNPDQRISEDISRFIDGGDVGYGIYSFSILLISNLSSLVSFAILLWILSANFTLPGTHIAVPGFLFWAALIYAAVGTWLTHWIGNPLALLSFKRQRYEADFRFSLARLREYTEQVALLSGEETEKRTLRARFGAIVANYFEIISCRKRLTAFTASYSQISPFIPYIVSAPFYFAGKITLGIMTQTASAFSNVNSALTFVVTYYVYLADYKSVLDRLNVLRPVDRKGRCLRAASAARTCCARRRECQPRGSDAASAGRAHDHRGCQSRSRLGNSGSFRRSLGLRQIDPIPRHRGHLALWPGQDRSARVGEADAAAAKALYPDRQFAYRARLSRCAGALRRRDTARRTRSDPARLFGG